MKEKIPEHMIEELNFDLFAPLTVLSLFRLESNWILSLAGLRVVVQVLSEKIFLLYDLL